MKTPSENEIDQNDHNRVCQLRSVLRCILRHLEKNIKLFYIVDRANSMSKKFKCPKR